MHRILKYVYKLDELHIVIRGMAEVVQVPERKGSGGGRVA